MSIDKTQDNKNVAILVTSIAMTLAIFFGIGCVSKQVSGKNPVLHWGPVLEVKTIAGTTLCAIRMNDVVTKDSARWISSQDYRDSDFCSLSVGDEVKLMRSPGDADAGR